MEGWNDCPQNTRVHDWPGPTGRVDHARIISVVIGVLLAVGSLGLLGAGGVALWASTTQRHGGAIDLGSWVTAAPGTPS